MSSSPKDERNPKKGWDELFFGTIERIAQAPSKLKDSKEAVTAALDWVKTVRDDVQDRIVAEVSERISKIDWDNLSQRVSDHLVENYEIEVQTTIRFRPRSDRSQRFKKTQNIQPDQNIDTNEEPGES